MKWKEGETEESAADILKSIANKRVTQFFESISIIVSEFMLYKVLIYVTLCRKEGGMYESSKKCVVRVSSGWNNSFTVQRIICTNGTNGTIRFAGMESQA